MSFHIFKKNRGFSMVEMLVYIAVMTVVVLIVVEVVLFVSKSIKQSMTYNIIKDSAISGLEKITKEIRFSEGIDLSQSVFNSTNGILSLNSKDEYGTSRTAKIYLDNSLVKVDIDGNYFGPATYSDTFVSSLKFVLVDTGSSQAVKIEMSIGVETISEGFYSTVVLRNSY